MVEVRTCEEDGETVARLMREVWAPEYGGKVPMPLWEGRHIDWQFLADGAPRDFLLAAYDGARLAGVMFAEPVTFRLRGEEVLGSFGRFLTVHPDYRSDLTALRLIAELRRRHLERGRRCCVGFALGGRASPSGLFWAAMARAFPKLTVSLGRVGYWVRFLDHGAFARWSRDPLESWGAWVLGFVQRAPRPRPDPPGVRAYALDDLADGVRLVRKTQERVELGYAWDLPQLRRQLQYQDLARTLVADLGGRVEGLLNYYALDCLANGTLRIGLIDMLALGDLKGRQARSLIRAALRRMRSEGVQMALMLRLASWPWGPLIGTGFVPVPTDHSVVCLRMDPTLDVAGVRRFYVPYR